MIKRKTIRILAVILCVVSIILVNLNTSMRVKAASDKQTKSETSQEISVYAKTERSIVNEYTVEVKDKKAELTVGDITLKVSKIPSEAMKLVVYDIPTTETEAWNWFEECLDKKELSAVPRHIMDIYFLDKSGKRINANGVEIIIFCTHCGSIPMLCAIDTDGNPTVLWSAFGLEKQATFTANGSHYYIIAEKKTVSGNTSDNTPNEDKPSDNHQPDNTPSENKPSNNGNQQNDKPQQGQNTERGEQPYIEGKSEINGWENIKEQLHAAKEKDTITVEMNGTTVVSGDIFDTIKGRDITIVFEMGEGIFWTVNGEDITKDKVGNIDFGVTVGKEAGKTIPIEVINNVTGERFFMNLTLAYDGEFGFKAVLTLNVEPKHAGLFANLFYYNPQAEELEYMCAGQIDEDGNAELTFTHASDYTIVIDENDMGQMESDMTEDDTKEVSAPETEEKKENTDGNLWIVFLILAVLVVGTVLFILMQKKKGKNNV